MYVHGERRKQLSSYAPYARFQMPAIFDTGGYEITFYLGKLFEAFVKWANPRNERSVWLNLDAGNEGGIGGLWIDGQYAGTSKLFLYNGNNPKGWQGIIIRDHIDLGLEKVDDIFRIAKKFEEFLKEKEIPYIRYNMKFPERQEVLAE